MTGKELLDQYRKEGIKRVKLGLTDVDGVIRGKYISMDKFASIADSTSGFCDCVLGWDMDDQLYDNTVYTGWHTAYPDVLYRLDLSTERRLRDEGGIPFFIGSFVDSDGDSLHPICPRSRLQHLINQAAEMGLGLRLALEYEFFVFNETSQSARDKNYINMVPLSPGNFGYSVLRTLTHSDLFNELMEYCDQHGFPLEGLHCETGPGVWEAALAVDECMNAADKASLFKTFVKAFFQRRGLMATFMAKWSMDYPGQSGHLHQSVYDLESGKNLFFDSGKEHGMSSLMRNYLAGQQKYLKPLLSLMAPTINSYTRLVKGAWAPTAATWGVENRTAALRVIGGSEKSQRIEMRIGSADANPYLAAAACLGSGLLGVREGLEPGEPVTGNAYEIQDSLPVEWQLPGNLRDSARNLDASTEARQILGDEFIDHFVASRLWEVREYERHVNDWQLGRYFEIV